MTPIRYIRTKILKINQTRLAEICGVGQGTISRWENDTAPGLPDAGDLASIRDYAKDNGIPLEERLFFEVPSESES